MRRGSHYCPQVPRIPSRFNQTTGGHKVVTQQSLLSTALICPDWYIGELEWGKGRRDRTKVTKKKPGESILFSPLLTQSPAEEPYAAEIPDGSSISQSPAALRQHPRYTDGATDWEGTCDSVGRQKARCPWRHPANSHLGLEAHSHPSGRASRQAGNWNQKTPF